MNRQYENIIFGRATYVTYTSLSGFVFGYCLCLPVDSRDEDPLTVSRNYSQYLAELSRGELPTLIGEYFKYGTILRLIQPDIVDRNSRRDVDSRLNWAKSPVLRGIGRGLFPA